MIDGLETLAQLDDWRQYVDGLKAKTSQPTR